MAHDTDLIPISSDPLLDRQRELDMVDSWLSDAQHGRGRIALVLASAGLGKSTLLRRSAEIAARAGMQALSATASELEREMPFGLAEQLFGKTVAALDESERTALLEGAARHTRSLLGLAGDETPADALAVLHGLYWLLANLADRSPLLLAIDDLHWADSQMLRWLTYVAPRISDLPVVILAAARPDEPSGKVVTALAADPCTATLTLQPLSVRAVGDLVSREFGRPGDRRFVEACHAAAGGNPFFVRELLRAAAADGIEPIDAQAADVPHLGSREVARSILVRLARLGAPARHLANAVAILGVDAEIRHAAALSEVSIDEAFGAWDRLGQAAILRPTQPLEFIHPIARTAVYQELPPGERTRLHRRAAEILAADRAEPRQIAVHALACEPSGDPVIVRWLREAAERALASGAPDAAARYLRRAMAEPPEPELRPHVQFELGQALVGVDYAAAAEAFLDAGSGAVAPLDVLAYRWAGAALFIANRPGEGDAAFQRAVELADSYAVEPDSRMLLAATRDHYAVHWANDPRSVDRRRQLERLARDLEGNTPGERRVLAIAALSIAHTASASAALAVELANRVRSNLPVWLDADGGTETANGIGNSGIISDDPHGLERHDRASAQAAEKGWLINLAFGRFQQAMIRYRLGALVDAEADARESWEILGQARELAPVLYWWSAAGLTQILIARGEIDEAADLVESTDLCRRQHEIVTYPWPPVLAAELALAQGRTADAIEVLQSAGPWLEQRGFTNPSYVPWRAILAPALAATGRQDEAETVIGPAVARARSFGAPWALGMALRAAAAVRPGMSGVDLAREAIAVLEPAGCRLEQARALMELGAMLRRGNRRAEAREQLRSSVELAHQCGASSLARAAEQELAATGARPRRVMLSGVESLTASELRVAQLAAAGRSNPEIAQSLFVTRKTVETHLVHVYLKLDIHSRKELPAALGYTSMSDVAAPVS